MVYLYSCAILLVEQSYTINIYIYVYIPVFYYSSDLTQRPIAYLSMHLYKKRQFVYIYSYLWNCYTFSQTTPKTPILSYNRSERNCISLNKFLFTSLVFAYLV
ncbi:uncharacterized protein RJT20DRAFT_55759 [Scheffersomyces xylosifermentans]|uniref:uncharacterized protein n=1 Tax=Scheffersomyces xylosifermentans TaxID=1304137 RepID=UPI00315CF39B